MKELEELIQHANSLGWFGGTHTVFTIECRSGFEAFSGRASETWERQFVITLHEIRNTKGEILNPSMRATNRSLEVATDVVMKAINRMKTKAVTGG